MGPLPRFSAGWRCPHPARPLGAPGQGTEPQPLSLGRGGQRLGRRAASDLEPSAPRQLRGQEAALYLSTAVASALLLHPVPSGHTQKAGGARAGGPRPQCTEAAPAGGRTLSRAREVQPHTSGPCSEALRALGLAYILCLGTGLLLPGLSFPICAAMGGGTDAVSPFQPGEALGLSRILLGLPALNFALPHQLAFEVTRLPLPQMAPRDRLPSFVY